MRARHDWFGFTSYWLRKWREFYEPITERSNAKPIESKNAITFDTQLKTLYHLHVIANTALHRVSVHLATGMDTSPELDSRGGL